MGGSITVDSMLGRGTTFTFAIQNKRPQVQRPRRSAEGEVESMRAPPGCVLNISGVIGGVQDSILNESSRGLVDPASISSKQLLKPPEELQVLIIDDDFSCTHVLKLFCSSLKVHADTAASGEEGVEMLKTRLSEPSRPPYELFFLDMHMPGMNGLETATCICDLYRPRDLSPTIIGLSGDSGDELKLQCSQAGIKELLLKPFGRQELCRVLQRYILPT